MAWQEAYCDHGNNEGECCEDENVADGGRELANAAGVSQAVPSREQVFEVVDEVVAVGEGRYQGQITERGVVHIGSHLNGCKAQPAKAEGKRRAVAVPNEIDADGDRRQNLGEAAG